MAEENKATRSFFAPRDIPKTGDDRAVKNIWLFAWRMAGKHQIAICALSLTVAALTVAPIELQKRIINDAIEPKDFNLLLVLGGVYLGVILLRRALKFAFFVYQDWLSHSAIVYCRKQLAGLKQQSMDAIDDEEKDADESGRSVSVIQSEMDKVGRFVGTGFSDPVADLAKLLFAFGYMIITQWTIAAVALLFFLPQFLLVPLLQRVLNRLIRKKTDLLRDMADEISSLDHEGDLPDRFVARVDGVFHNEMRSTVFKQLIKALINILNALAPLSVLVFGGYLFMQGETTLGVIVAFMSGFERMAGPTRALVQYYRMASIRNEQHGKVAEWIRQMA